MEEGSETTAAEPQEPGRPGKPSLPELNEACVVGRMINNPKMREGAGAQGDYKMARFMLGVNRTYKDSSGKRLQETAFVPVVVWRALAEAVSKAGKGTALRIGGRIKTWQVEGKNYRWELQGNTLEVLDLRAPVRVEPEEAQKELLPS